MVDRTLLRLSAVLLVVGEVLYQVAEQFHPEGGQTANDVFTSYANSPWWALVHEAQFAGSVIALLGIITLLAALHVNAGVWGIVGRLAVALAVASVAVNAALYAVDGVGLKEAIDSWVSAPAPTQPAFFAVVEGVRGVEWGLRSYVDFTTSLTLALLALVIVRTARVSRLIGALVGVSSLAYLVQGFGYGAGYTAISEHFVLSSTNYQFVMFVWVAWLLISAWRMKTSVQAAAIRAVPEELHTR